MTTAMIETQPTGDLGLIGALVDSGTWNRLVKVAEIFAKSKLVPAQFQNNVGDCIIALQMAIRMEVDPFMLMQGMYVVHGRPGIESKLAIALCNNRKVFRGPIRYQMEGEGKTRSCTAWAIDRETGDRLEETVNMAIAEREGWTKKAGSKWLTIPDLMLKYRAAMWLIRTHCPEVLMGLQSRDELVDSYSHQPGPESDPVGKSRTNRLADMLNAEPEIEVYPDHGNAGEESQVVSEDLGEEPHEIPEDLGEEPQTLGSVAMALIARINEANTKATAQRVWGEAQQLHLAGRLSDHEFAEIKRDYEACQKNLKK